MSQVNKVNKVEQIIGLRDDMDEEVDEDDVDEEETLDEVIGFEDDSVENGQADS